MNQNNLHLIRTYIKICRNISKVHKLLWQICIQICIILGRTIVAIIDKAKNKDYNGIEEDLSGNKVYKGTEEEIKKQKARINNINKTIAKFLQARDEKSVWLYMHPDSNKVSNNYQAVIVWSPEEIFRIIEKYNNDLIIFVATARYEKEIFDKLIMYGIQTKLYDGISSIFKWSYNRYYMDREDFHVL